MDPSERHANPTVVLWETGVGRSMGEEGKLEGIIQRLLTLYFTTEGEVSFIAYTSHIVEEL